MSDSIKLIPVYTGDQVRAAEEPLLATDTGDGLMRRAAAGLSHHILKLLQRTGPGSIYGRKVSAVVGSGNNGGDALYALASLRRRGVNASAVVAGDSAHPRALEAFCAAGGRVVTVLPAGVEVLIDALTGTGYRPQSGRSLRWPEAGLDQVVGAIRAGAGEAGPDHAARPYVVACDLPSGVDAQSGQADASCLAADLTVTFGAVKQGLLVGAGAELSGVIEVVDIGLGPHLPAPKVWATADSLHPEQAPEPQQTTGLAPETLAAGPRAAEATVSRRVHAPRPAGPDQKYSRVTPGPQQAGALTSGNHAEAPGSRWVHAARPATTDHKYSRGTLEVVAGSAQYPGAAVLSAGAALTLGVGMLQLRAPEPVRQAVLARYPEVVGLEPDAVLSATAQHTSVKSATSGSKHPRALVVGPGIGEDADQIAAVQQALAAHDQQVPTVIDASALEILRPEHLRQLGGHHLLTPHLGELRRLMDRATEPGLLDTLATNPLAAVGQFAGLTGATLLLKGATTMVAEPNGASYLHRSHAPGLATAGSGDVLSGMLGALLVTGIQHHSIGELAILGAACHAHRAQLLDPAGAGQFGASWLLSPAR